VAEWGEPYIGDCGFSALGLVVGATYPDAAARLRQAELDAREAVDRALAARDEAAARSTALGRAADRMVEVTRIQKLLLEVGSGTQVDYLAAEAELATTRASLAEARTAELVARVELARAAGDLTPEWLEENLSESAAIADSAHRPESESEP
jgi:outer membrane protein TolC